MFGRDLRRRSRENGRQTIPTRVIAGLWAAFLCQEVRGQVGVTLCACQPSVYTFEIDLGLTCADKNIESGQPGVLGADCFARGLDLNANVTDVVPTFVNSILVSELNSKTTPINNVPYKQTFVTGSTFTYTSLAASPDAQFDPDTFPAGIQLDLVGQNAGEEPITNVWVIKFSNDCGVFPVLKVGDQIGWTKLIDFQPPLEALCPAAAMSASPTVSPAPTTATPTAPTMSQMPSARPTSSRPTGIPQVISDAPSMVPSAAVKNETKAPSYECLPPGKQGKSGSMPQSSKYGKGKGMGKGMGNGHRKGKGKGRRMSGSDSSKNGKESKKNKKIYYGKMEGSVKKSFKCEKDKKKMSGKSGSASRPPDLEKSGKSGGKKSSKASGKQSSSGSSKSGKDGKTGSSKTSGPEKKTPDSSKRGKLEKSTKGEGSAKGTSKGSSTKVAPSGSGSMGTSSGSGSSTKGAPSGSGSMGTSSGSGSKGTTNGSSSKGTTSVPSSKGTSTGTQAPSIYFRPTAIPAPTDVTNPQTGSPVMGTVPIPPPVGGGSDDSSAPNTLGPQSTPSLNSESPTTTSSTTEPTTTPPVMPSRQRHHRKPNMMRLGM